MSNQSSDKSFKRRDFLKGIAGATLATTSLSSFSTNALFAAPTSDIQSVADSPYGVCAHIGGGEEWEQAPQNLELMKKAGIRWVRADFSWSGVEGPQGTWHYDHLDAILDKTEKVGLQVLPILNYDVPWATPAHKHLDAWLQYVKNLVSRYKDRIRYWEVWNEENIGFWRDEPNGADYAKLLAATYNAIKEIDPQLIVVYGGLAGTPIEYFEASLDAEAAKYFDVLNVHPYRGGLSTPDRIETFKKDLTAFNEALKKRGLPERPLWITEMGWATPPTLGEVDRRVIAVAIDRLYPNEKPRIAFFYDNRFDGTEARPKSDMLRRLPSEYLEQQDLVSFWNLDELKKLQPQDADMLIMPPGENYLEDAVDVVANFVKNGGTLVLTGGVPYYYPCAYDSEKNRIVRKQDNPKGAERLKELRVSWFAWWTRENVPETVGSVVAPETQEFYAASGKTALNGYQTKNKSTRFFDDKELRPGDRMISIIDGKDENFTASSACIYDFNSDYKGAVVVSSIFDTDGFQTNQSTVYNQALFLPQALLLSFEFGVERYFWYEFQAPERDDYDPEHHFGIVGQTLKPKPAYYAYSALTKARPAGSVKKAFTLGENVIVSGWKRPDGKTAWALWCPWNTPTVKLNYQGKITQAFDYLGNDVKKPEKNGTLQISSEILYLIGPEELSCE